MSKKNKAQRDKQSSTDTTHKKDRATRTLLKTVGDLIGKSTCMVS